MTGRDVPTRQKTLSVAFSVIMVLSMVAMGVAGFAGSAAAQTTDDNIVTGSVIADSADSGATARHIFRIEVGGDLAGNNLQNITLNYSDINLDSATGIGTGTQGIDVGDGGEVRIFIGGTEIQDGGATTLDAELNGDGDTLTLGADNNAGDSRTIDAYENVGGGSTDPSLSEGDVVTVVISDTATDLVNPSSTQDVSATIGDDAGNEGTVSEMELSLDGDAPIAYDDDGDTSTNTNHSVISSALDDVGAQGDNVTVRGTVDNTDPTGTDLFSIGSTISNDDVTVEGQDDAEILFDGAGGNLITLDTDIDNFELRNIAFDGNTDDVGVIAQATDAFNQTIEQNEFSNFSANNQPVLDLQVDDGGNAVTLDVNNNKFDDIDVNNNNVVNINAGSASVGESTIQVNNNEVNFNVAATGGTGINIADASGIGAVSLITNDVFGSDDTLGTGISLANINDNVTVQDGSIDFVDTGINVGDSGGDFVDISGTTFTNITDTGAGNGAISVSDGGGADDVFVDDVTILDSENGDGLNFDDTGTNLEVTNSEINDTTTGISVNDVGTQAVISSTSVDYSGTAIDVNNPAQGGQAANVVVNESVSIDQGDNGIVLTHDVDNVLDVDIDGVTVNGTAQGAVNITDMDHNTDGNNIFNVTNSEFTNNNAGIGLEDITGGNVADDIGVHFNTFEANTVGIEIDEGNDNFQGTFSATFNDFVDNENDALRVVNIDAANSNVNANYSWWDNRDYSRIVGPYTPQNAVSQLPIPRRVYSYTRLHTGGQP